MRILVLSQYFAPEPVHKPADLARWLCDAGHDVEVLTGLPHYPTGRLYPGYRLRPWRREWRDGIRVLRTFEVPYHGRSAAGRMVNYASFMLSAIVGGMFVSRPQVIYVWHPPLTIGVAAWAIARLRRCPFVYDVQDIWPESAVVSGLLRDGPLVRWLSRLERFVYARADHLIVVTEGARENLARKGVPVSRISVLPPVTGVDDRAACGVEAVDRDDTRARHGWTGRFVVLFAGNLGAVQGLDAVVRAARQLPDDSRALVVLLGEGSEREHLVTLVQASGLAGRVQFIERQPVERMPHFMAASDVLLVHLKASALSTLILPSKTLSCLAAGRPILMGATGAAADLILQARAGPVVAPEDEAALASAILALERAPDEDRAAMGRNGRSYLDQHMAKSVVLDRHRAVIEFTAAGAA